MIGNLIIRVDASTQMGTGHLMRCLALAQAWKDTGGKVTFITACQSSDLLQRPREEDFELHVLSHPYPDAGDWEHTKNILAAHPSAWVVLDGYHFDEAYQQAVKETGHRLLVIDDMAHLKHYYADIVLNQNLHAEQVHYSCEPYARLLLGTHYVLLRREFLAWKNWKRKIPKIARWVLVTLGGGDPENHTLKVIQALQKVDMPGLEAIVVVGASNPHVDVLESAISQSQIPIRLICNAGNMPELMAWADMAISTAGSTVWELMFVGLPALLIVAADNQEPIARSMVDAGTAILMGCRLADRTRMFSEEVSQSVSNVNRQSKLSELSSKESLVKIIKSLAKDNALRLEMSKKGKKLVDGKGLSRIMAAILQEVLV
ncbi:MAG: UDP-2,4-diacetamido-2,4,6-trideoxy-beta-L-altropyranose hydrolase [Dehalococcoidia bacterium]|nr:UDP-2,4-diacetamido-2,4,6-trideoxy-beta-L-altropyranose hydrolase [Dehalococcoidia bacterium]